MSYVPATALFWSPLEILPVAGPAIELDLSALLRVSRHARILRRQTTIANRATTTAADAPKAVTRVDEEEPDAITVVGLGDGTGLNLSDNVGEGVGDVGVIVGEGVSENEGEGVLGEVTGAGFGGSVGEGVGEAGTPVGGRVPENVGEGETDGIAGAGLGESVGGGVGLVDGPVVHEPVVSSMTDPNESEEPEATTDPSDIKVIARIESDSMVPC